MKIARSQKWILGAVAVLSLSAGVANAQATVMPAITFPITLASIATEVGVAGAAILVLVVPLALGFKLVRKLIKRGSAAV